MCVFVFYRFFADFAFQAASDESMSYLDLRDNYLKLKIKIAHIEIM